MLKRYLLLLLVAAGLLLAACQSGSTSAENPTLSPANDGAAPKGESTQSEAYSETEGESSQVENALPEATAASSGILVDFPVSGTMPGCTAVSLTAEPDPEVESLFAPVSDSDWVLGKEDASVTIVEYGDFQ